MRFLKRGIFTATVESYIDIFINFAAVFAGYAFSAVLYGVANEINVYHPYFALLIFLNLFAASFIYHVMGLYKPSRYVTTGPDLTPVLKANLIYFGFMTTLAVIFSAAEYLFFVFRWAVFTVVISTVALTLKRRLIRIVLRLLKDKGDRLRTVIICGDNREAMAEYIRESEYSSSGLAVVIGYASDKIGDVDIGAEKLGELSSLEKILDTHRPTDAVFAVEAYNKERLIRLVNICDERCIRVYFLPVIYGFFKNSAQIEQVGRIPVLNIHATPLDNIANAQIKRAVDIIGSALLIIITAPIMLFAVIGVRFSSSGPILFKQKRVGKGGREFSMLKFRSMRVNEESDKAWTTGTDPRKTRFGAFLRRTAIDELPQLFNVLSGSMSLVGPRPEIPVFVNRFKQTVPLYMVKHYVKPGITGLAQIKGLRGDTSIEARIREDIDYIENWSLMLDILILLKTPFKAFNKNEKYVGQNEKTKKGRKK